VPAETDSQVVADLLAGPIFYRHLVSRAPLDDAYADQVVAAVVAAVTALAAVAVR
jgi:Tetracyclin repressor-like, C-terminal domain